MQAHSHFTLYVLTIISVNTLHGGSLCYAHWGRGDFIFFYWRDDREGGYGKLGDGRLGMHALLYLLPSTYVLYYVCVVCVTFNKIFCQKVLICIVNSVEVEKMKLFYVRMLKRLRVAWAGNGQNPMKTIIFD